MAETYGILNYRALPARTVGTLLMGLRPSSRIQMAISKTSITFEQSMSALMVDYLALLVWQRTEDAKHGRNRPQSISEKLIDRKPKGFRTPEEFEAARLAIIRS